MFECADREGIELGDAERFEIADAGGIELADAERFEIADAGGFELADAERFEIADAGGEEGEYSLFSSRTHLITLKLRGGKGVRGWERDEGLARCGDRWPSGARPSQPQPDGPGSRARAAEWRSGNRGAAETPRREERSRR